MTRHPYSFVGDYRGPDEGRSLPGGTWHEGLKGYTDGTEQGALRAEASLQAVGAAAGRPIQFDFAVEAGNWQPVESQRTLAYPRLYRTQGTCA